jgi:hypothetical protein
MFYCFLENPFKKLNFCAMTRDRRIRKERGKEKIKILNEKKQKNKAYREKCLGGGHCNQGLKIFT